MSSPPQRRRPASYPRRLLVAATLCWASSGAAVACDPTPIPPPLCTGGIVPNMSFEPLASYDEACPATRWVAQTRCPGEYAVLDEGSGSEPIMSGGGSWQPRPLIHRHDTRKQLVIIAGGSTGFYNDAVASARADELLDGCIYQWSHPEGSGPVISDIDTLKKGVKGAALDRDCRVVIPLTAPPDSRMWQAAHDTFIESVEPLSYDELASAAQTPSWVGVIDDRPETDSAASVEHPAVAFDSDGAARGAMHGLMMRNIISELTCIADLNQVVRASDALSFQALDLEVEADGEVASGVLGGHFGYQSTLAEATADAVVEWLLSDENATGKRNGVFLMALGFDERYAHPAADPTALTTPVAALRGAIELATCGSDKHALFIAAAGNDTSGALGDKSAPTGPMYPAAFERLPLVSACQQGGGLYQPLVHAVGGYNYRGRPIAIGRKDGLPRLLAPAFWAATDPDAGCIGKGQPRPKDVFTGTSVAAAVVVAIAANGWSWQPKFTGAQLMAAIYDSGVDDGEAADFCVETTSPCATRKHISLCQAHRAMSMGAADPSTCPSSAAVYRPSRPWEGAEDVFNGAVDPTRTVSLSVLLDVPDCNTDYVTNSCLPLPTQVCPYRQTLGGGELPWRVKPQPGSDCCPTCILAMDAPSQELILTMNLAHAVDTATLTVNLVAGRPLSYDLNAAYAGRLGAGSLNTVSLGPLPRGVMPQDVTGAFLSFVEGGRSAMSEVAIQYSP